MSKNYGGAIGHGQLQQRRLEAGIKSYPPATYPQFEAPIFLSVEARHRRSLQKNGTEHPAKYQARRQVGFSSNSLRLAIALDFQWKLYALLLLKLVCRERSACIIVK